MLKSTLVGAVLISLALIYLWGGTTISCLFSLAGRGITGEFTNLIIYNAMYFSDDIVAVDQVTCYSAGSKYGQSILPFLNPDP